ncbi:hemagglutinin [Mycoplasmopsis synoviae]|nr:putative phase-variable hemagglutinin [Mycoplasmopsis synoviae]AWL84066.1 hemagglutinin [Mycoplasmopsis synoviae]
MKNKKIKLLLAASAVAIAPAVIAISCGDQTPAPAPTPGNPNTDNPQNPNPGNPGTDNSQNPNPGNPGGGTVDPVEAAKTEAKTAIDASAELSDSVKEALKRQVEATTTEAAARDLKTKTEALVSAVKALSGSVTAAKAVKDDAQYDSVDATLKTTLEEKYTAATALLEDETKLANLNADGTLATTQSDLESAKTDLDAAVAAVKPDLDFQKTKTSATAKVTELDALVNTALKAELQRQVNELTKEQAAQATTMLANLTSLKESLESLQTLVSNGLKMQVDYPQKYYDADNKADFDAALLKASSVFPAFKWTAQSIMVPAPEGDALPNPRAWTKAREKSEFKLQNFIMAPAQAAAPTTAQTSPSAAASATVRVAMGEDSAEEGAASVAAQAPQAPTTPDLASTVSYLKTLDTDLKAQTAALNGDTTTNKTAYYKPVNGRTLYWDGFMPKIVVQGYVADTTGRNKDTNEVANLEKLKTWFATPANWEKLSEQLTKKLGASKFKNVVLTAPTVSYEDDGSNTRIPKVTFTLQGKDGYTLQTDNGASQSLTLSIRVLYTTENQTENALKYQGVSFSAVPNNTTTVNDENVSRTVNVYLNYTGPAIVLDQAVPAVSTAANTLINGTSNVTGAFNNAFRGLLFTKRLVNPLMQSVINYVNKFDPKFRAQLVTDTNGVALTKVQKDRQKKIENLDQEI